MSKEHTPVVALDVDGVLLVISEDKPVGWQQYRDSNGEFEPYTYINPLHGPWLRQLMDQADIHYVTAHGSRANKSIGAPLGLPKIPFVNYHAYTPMERDSFIADKRQALHELFERHPLIWIDDDINDVDQAWAAHRSAPTLTIVPKATEGLQLESMHEIDEWLLEIVD